MKLETVAAVERERERERERANLLTRGIFSCAQNKYKINLKDEEKPL